MKHIISLLLILVLCISSAGCSKNQQSEAAEVITTKEAVTESAGPTPDQKRLLNQYNDIVDRLLDDSREIAVTDNGVYLTGSAALECYYNRLLAMEEVDELIEAGYGNVKMDRQALLSKFIIIPDVHLSSTGTATDRLGNVEDYYFAGHTLFYNADGSVNKEMLNNPGYKGTVGYHEYTYDDNGLLISKKVRRFQYDTEVTMFSTFEHNDMGQVIKETVNTNDGTYTTTYSYDTEGRILKVEDFRSSYTYSYSYNADGQLIRMHKEPIGYTESFVYEEDYTYLYEGDTPVGAKLFYNYYMRLNGQYPIQRYNADIAYTCDDQGRVIQEDWTFSDFVSKKEEQFKYVSRQILHIYGDYYIFTN